MGIFGLGANKKTVVKPGSTTASKVAKPAKSASQNDEAKAILAKMAAKKDAGDCPFC